MEYKKKIGAKSLFNRYKLKKFHNGLIAYIKYNG